MRRLWIKAICLFLALPLALACYALWWGVAYRLPRGKDIMVDMRSPLQKRLGESRQLQFCAGLANNPHGFPGHAYVIWSGAKSQTAKSSIGDETLGFCPGDFWSIVPSVYRPVSGVVDGRAADGNDRNLEKMTVLVDPVTFYRTRALADQWDARQFRTGTRDCCAFVDSIAREAGLKIPDHQYLYPHDHIRELKRLNGRMQETAQADSAQKP